VNQAAATEAQQREGGGGGGRHSRPRARLCCCQACGQLRGLRLDHLQLSSQQRQLTAGARTLWWQQRKGGRDGVQQRGRAPNHCLQDKEWGEQGPRGQGSAAGCSSPQC
jgi:hypothetical protein